MGHHGKTDAYSEDLWGINFYHPKPEVEGWEDNGASGTPEVVVEEARDTSDMVLGFSEKDSSAKSAKRAAEKHNLAPATVRRDADYARAVDRLGEVFGREFKSWILAVAKLQRCAVRLSYRSNVERASLHGASRRPHTFPPTLLVRCSSVVSIIAVQR